MPAALLALMLAAMPYAPLGLHWGMSPVEVRKALEPRFAFVREQGGSPKSGGMMLVFHGDYARAPTEELSLIFVKGELQGLIVMLAGDEPSRTYEEFVGKMTSAHGPPTRATVTPEGAPSDYLRLAWLDSGLKKGRWKANSEWELEGGTLGTVEVIARGKRLAPEVVFASPTLRKLLDAQPPPVENDL